MATHGQARLCVDKPAERPANARLPFIAYCFGLAMVSVFAACKAYAQVSVVTAHNDLARTGQNLAETVLTPAVVNSAQFGKLFTQATGEVHAQPLYVAQVAIPKRGVHNVVYIATSAGIVYAFDADSNGGSDATSLWKTSLLATVPGSVANAYSVIGTPVIDLSSHTLYVVCQALESGVLVFRLHALDIATGAEKMGGPVPIQGSVAGTGSGSTAGVLAFDPAVQIQRPGLLLLNGVVYAAFGSLSDMGAYHGWLFSFDAATLGQLGIYCTTPNGSEGGIWVGGAGLAAEVNDPTRPFGRMFVVTGNGSYSASTPYTDAMSYGMSVVNLDLTGGVMTVQDEFTPYNEAHLDSEDGDLGSGGAVLLPAQTLASGATLNPLVQVGKYGSIAILDRNNLGGFNITADQVVQEVKTPAMGTSTWGAGIWGSPAYWNQNLYFGGTNPGASNSLTAYSFVNGVISAAPTSQSPETFAYPGPSPSVSSSGTTNGIVWALKTDARLTNGPEVLLAYDATNLANTLYSSNTDLLRDNPGVGVTYAVPTIANGKVYVGSASGISVYGLLAASPAAAPPAFTPAGGTFSGSQTVTITDATAGAQIYYTTDGSIPTAASRLLYSGPITVTSTETISAIASANGLLQSGHASATFTALSSAANPVFSLASGTYTGSQTLTISDASPAVSIYYTVDGSTPTTASIPYTQPISVPVSETIEAIAVSPTMSASATVAGTYTIAPAYAFSFPDGFAQAQGPIEFNGSTGLDDFRLQLTNGGTNQAGSAFYATPVNIQAFTTDFAFQLSNPAADGITFTIENVGPAALGSSGGGLGYQGIANSLAIKFDLANNAGEGSNSTGLFTAGAAPTVPCIKLAGTGIDLHSGDYMAVHLTYDGAALNMTISDQLTGAVWSQMFPVNIPAIVGSTTAYVGFTGGTSAWTSSQKITSWSYLPGPPPVPNYPAGFDANSLAVNGAQIRTNGLYLTNGGTDKVTSVYYAIPVDIASFTTDFDFQMLKAVADGFTFVLQNNGATAIGSGGGGLGYQGMADSVAIKFDIYNNAGEGTDSTGIYTNGAAPTVPALDLTASQVQLSGGDWLHAHVVYDGTNLTWTITDATAASQPGATNSVAINIPGLLGSNVAYVGFTAASGDGIAVQRFLDWTFTNP